MKLLSTLAVTAAALAFVMPAAALSVYTTPLSGLNENPQTPSPATGAALVTIDQVNSTMRVEVTFAGLIGGNATAGHIHCCIAAPGNIPVSVGFPSFPPAMSGTYDRLFDMTNSAVYTASFRNTFGSGTAAGSFSALIAGLNAGTAYVNIHNTGFPPGEIRGFLQAVPEPGTWALMLGGLGLVGAAVKHRRSAA